MTVTPLDAAADERFLLDLLNSTPIVDGVQHDELATAAAGRAWLRAHGHAGSPGEWRVLREARDGLQALIRGERSVRVLSGLLDAVSSVPVFSDGGLRWELRTPADQRAAVRAVVAWDALHRGRPGRLRPCENPECALFLIDRSKPNNARWCSMATCGNRLKARRHHERTRGSQH
jgi:predicted RNA-binding Zn ribbon-like protein